MKFTKEEIKEITISTVVLSLAFSIAFLGIENLSLESFLLSLFVVGGAFVAHELLGHKLFAQKFGASAEYRMWPMGLLFALVSSFFGFVFAAPGAVYFSPVVRGRFAFTVHRLTKKEIGIIALAGPAVNIALGAIFFGLSFFALRETFLFGAYISFFLGFFNLLPLPPLDGSKVMAWSIPAWAVAIALAGLGYALL